MWGQHENQHIWSLSGDVPLRRTDAATTRIKGRTAAHQGQKHGPRDCMDPGTALLIQHLARRCCNSHRHPSR